MHMTGKLGSQHAYRFEILDPRFTGHLGTEHWSFYSWTRLSVHVTAAGLLPHICVYLYMYTEEERWLCVTRSHVISY